jgi:hypothetical protein
MRCIGVDLAILKGVVLFFLFRCGVKVGLFGEL